MWTTYQSPGPAYGSWAAGSSATASSRHGLFDDGFLDRLFDDRFFDRLFDRLFDDGFFDRFFDDRFVDRLVDDGFLDGLLEDGLFHDGLDQGVGQHVFLRLVRFEGGGDVVGVGRVDRGVRGRLVLDGLGRLGHVVLSFLCLGRLGRGATSVISDPAPSILVARAVGVGVVGHGGPQEVSCW